VTGKRLLINDSDLVTKRLDDMTVKKTLQP
jgi:hypothetical protein